MDPLTLTFSIIGAVVGIGTFAGVIALVLIALLGI
jgi:hypothetical protein